ncbi:TIGR04139 family peptide modification target [Pedobacter aquatilis]|uniref:TIGR04139 family peptide modification target n=1 Tax=Pedobacter aquatilis TaxID=351343 RepID=UPI00292D7BBD|nr:TIGR04139 family peptide modification target [Pedobacter aquatilis]
MKNLEGMQKSLSALENKKLTDLNSLKGGLAGGYTEIRSNVNVGEGCVEYDHYSGTNGQGTYQGRTYHRVAGQGTGPCAPCNSVC